MDSHAWKRREARRVEVLMKGKSKSNEKGEEGREPMIMMRRRKGQQRSKLVKGRKGRI